VWLRDSGPTGVYGARGFEWVRWAFNAWAKYDNYHKDERVARAVADVSGHPDLVALRPDGAGPLVLEGGGIEGNGAGTLMVTEEWLLSDEQVRNPGLTRADYEGAFREYLGSERTIWLGEGAVGDDTHGHVDDVARFVDANTVVLTWEPDPADENHRRMADNLRRLELAGRSLPGGLRVVKLPFPRPVVMDGERLPASYANFYIANGVVAVVEADADDLARTRDRRPQPYRIVDPGRAGRVLVRPRAELVEPTAAQERLVVVRSERRRVHARSVRELQPRLLLARRTEPDQSHDARNPPSMG
jgi:agmatine/peptidylarginine deiminase